MASNLQDLSSSPSAPLVPSVSSQKRRHNLVKAACNRCRAGKVKCDGKRPRCSRCSKLNDSGPCAYDVDDGDTRQDALRKKAAGTQKALQAAVGFIEALKDMPPEQVGHALARVRAASDTQTFLEQYATVGVSSDASSSNTSAVSPDPLALLQPRPEGYFKPSPGSGGSHTTAQNDSILFPFPNGDLVLHQQLIEETSRCFFEKSSKLFHVFSEDEIKTLADQIYNSTTTIPRTAVACVFSVCAVGCSYSQPGLSQEYEEALFDRAKMCLDDAIESCPAVAAKVCCMLGMRLLFMKNRASLTFIEMGIELCRREGMDLQTKPFEQSEAQWKDGRRTFRTLFFFASWLSASVGFLSKSPSWVGTFTLRNVDIGGEVGLEDLVPGNGQGSLLKFNILRFNLDGNPLTALSIGAISRDLKQWYNELPLEVHLINVQDPSVSVALRRTVYFCHLLYLGCLILLARRIIHSEVMSGNTFRLTQQLTDSESFIQDAVTAAQQTARILSLLRQENGVFKRCWLCIFQSYVALTMNLFAFAKQLLAKDYNVAHELSESAAVCLEVLEFCSSEDEVAARFSASCRPMLAMLNEYRTTVIPDPSLRQAAEKLLDMCCMPFGDDAEEHVPVIKNWQSVHPRLDDYDLVVSREQDFEASTPFHRNFRNIAPGPRVRSLLDALGPSRFLHDPAGDRWPDALRQG